jgi:hypothetical protein
LPLGAQFLKERPLVNALRAIKFNVRGEREESTSNATPELGSPIRKILTRKSVYGVQIGQCAEEILIEPSDDEKLKKVLNAFLDLRFRVKFSS